MNKNLLILFSALFLSSGILNDCYAAKPVQAVHQVGSAILSQINRAFFFEENRGQLMDENHNTITDVKYYGHSNGVYLYCKPGMISFVFIKTETDKNISEATGTTNDEWRGSPFLKEVDIFDLTKKEESKPSKIFTSQMDFVLVGSNPLAKITTSNEQRYFENFYTTGDANHGITKVHTYKTLTYKDIYPHIDLILNEKGQGMEYSFLVHPGGNVSDIQLRWDGADNENRLKSGGVKYSNNLGSIKEGNPKSFSYGKALQTSLISKGKNFGFKVGSYSKNKELLIDPTLTWATYYGGELADQGNAISTDALGNVYITGATYSPHYIATSGAYQISHKGKTGYFDAFLAKFNSAGNLEWGTYFGGGLDDYGYSIKASGSSVYIAGTTNGTTGMATTGAYQTSFGGNKDAFVAKFNDSGAISWATYFGNGGYDGANAITVDGSGDVIFLGSTSTAGLATSGAFQTSLNGSTNAYIAKFSSLGKKIWVTYYGNGSHQENAVTTDLSGNIYTTGGDGSSSGLASSRAYKSVGSGYDGFLSKFNSSGSRIWGTYFGGNNQDAGQGIITDTSGNIYVVGSTQSTKGLATSGAMQTSYGGGYFDAFVAKFNNSGNLDWATYKGGSDIDQGTGISTDVFGNIIISGTSSSTAGISTSDAIQTSNAGGSDAFCAVYSNAGNLKWATYFGGPGNDGGNAIATDDSGNVYMTGITASLTGIATYNAQQDSNTGTVQFDDAFLAKYVYNQFRNDAAIDSLIKPSGVVCAGLQPVKVKVRNDGTIMLQSLDINWSVNGVIQAKLNLPDTLAPGASEITLLGNFNFSPGLCTIKAWTSKPNGETDSFPFNDTLKQTFKVNPVPLPVLKKDSVCLGGFIAIGDSAISGHRYKWTSPSGFISSLSNPNINPVINTLYILNETIVATGCHTVDSVKIKVNPVPVVAWSVSNSLKKYEFKTKDSSLSKSAYVWNFGDSSTIDTGYSVVHVFPKNKKYNVLLKVTNSSGCIGKDDSVINVTISGINPVSYNDLYTVFVYPNPFTDKTLVNFILPHTSLVKITIIDMKGNIRFTPANKGFPKGPNQIEIDAVKAGLTAGTYFVNIETDGQVISKKIIEVK